MIDKENVAPPSIGTRSQGKGGGGDDVMMTKRSSTDTSLPRLLLFTERADEVFLLNDGLPEVDQRRKLSEAVMADRGNPRVWWDLLQHVNKCFATDSAHTSQVRKLYQKATRIIPDALHKDDQELINIWLGFAQAEMRVSEQDAREAYEHMKLCGIGANFAAYYLAYASLEERCGRAKEAVSILELGLSRNVTPNDEIKTRLSTLRAGNPSLAASPTITFQHHPKDDKSKESRKNNPTLIIRPSVSPPVVASKAPDGDATLSFSLDDIGDALTGVITLKDRTAAGRTSSTDSTPPAPARQSSSPSGDTITFNIPELDLNKSSVVSFKSQQQQPKDVHPPHHPSPDDNYTSMISFKSQVTPKGASSSSSPSSVDAAAATVAKPTTRSAAANAQSSSSSSSSSESKDSSSAAAQKKTTAPPPSKPKRFLTTGLLGKIGKAERVRAERVQAEASSSSSSSSSSSKPASEEAEASSKSPSAKDIKDDNDDATIACPPLSSAGRAALGGLQPIEEDATVGKGSEETVAAGAKHPDLDHKSTLEVSFRVRESDGASNDSHFCQKATGSGRRQQHHHHPPHHHHHHHTLAAAGDEHNMTRERGRNSRGDDRPSIENESRTRSGSETVSSSAAKLSTGSSQANAGGHDQFSFDSLLSSRNIISLNDTQYLRLDVLGRGGSSKVFRVLSDSGQIYALKRVRVPPKDIKALESFANEITLLSRLKGHPCIIQLMDSVVDRSTGLVYMLMEMGEIDLSKLLAQSAAEDATGKLSLNFIRFTWEQMLRAVHCVHEERIVHGDLKPANFVFVRGRLKLIDFGIAKAIGNDTTNIMRESQVGTVNYMSPEAILDTGNGVEQPGGRRAPCMKIGRASDVWSLGCILYQLMYGKTPFADLNLIQKLHCIVDEKYQIPFPSSIEYDVVDIIQQCLRRDPTTRPPIAGGPGSLLEHVFLHPSSEAAVSLKLPTTAAPAPSAAASAGMKKTIEATLSVIEKEPDMIHLEPRQRIGLVYQRVSSLVNTSSSASSSKTPSSSSVAPAAASSAAAVPSSPLSNHPSHCKAPRPRTRAAASASSSTAAAAASSTSSSGRPANLTEQIVNQRSRLRPVEGGGGRRSSGKQHHTGEASPGGLRSMFEKGLAGIRAANITNGSDTGGSSCHNDTRDWSFN